MAVKVCGTILSSLFYDNGNSKTDQEGLLLGKVINKRTNTISDSQISAVKEENFTYIYSYIPCSSGMSWYDNAGRVDIDLLKQILSNHSPKDVVGWYRSRRNSTMTVSLRERSIHKHLKETFPGVANTHFVFLLCGMQSTANASTYCMEHVFLVNITQAFKASQAEVINLGDTAHNEYKMRPSLTVDKGSGDFVNTVNNTCNELMGKGQTLASVSSLIDVQNSISTKIKSLGTEVSTSERVISQLRAEINVLQSKLKLKEDHVTSQFVPVPVSPTSLTPREAPPRRQTSRGVSHTDGYQMKRLSGSSTSPTARKMSETEPDTPWKFDLEQGHGGEDVGKDSNTGSSGGAAKPMNVYDFVDIDIGRGKRGTKIIKVSPTVIEDGDSMETDEGPDLINLDEVPPAVGPPVSNHPHGDGESVADTVPKFMDSDDTSELDLSVDSQSVLHGGNPFITTETPGRYPSTTTTTNHNPFHSMLSPDVPWSSSDDSTTATKPKQTSHNPPQSTSSPAKKVKEDAFLEFLVDDMKSSIKPLSTNQTKGSRSQPVTRDQTRSKTKPPPPQGIDGIAREGDVFPRVTRSRAGAQRRQENHGDNDINMDTTYDNPVKDDILCESTDELEDSSRSPVF